MNPSDYDKENEKFVAALATICAKDSGHRAALRGWWSQATKIRAYPIFGRLGALDAKRDLTPRMVVAALYATHFQEGNPPHKAGGFSVGSAALCLGNRENETHEHPFDRHFRRILASDSLEDLAAQLNRFVKRLSRAEGGHVPLNYQLLLKQLRIWNSRPELRGRIGTDWAMDFWQAPAPADA
jgi:CRISPR type I-E-associated protein CasB/Cse2